MNRPLILVLIGVTLAASQCWYSDLTDNDSNKKITDAAKKNCQEKVGRSKEGCTLAVKCNEGTDRSPGYYFEGDYNGEGVTVRCRNKNWFLVDGSKVPICLRGCTALDDYFMINATYHNTPPSRVYRNGANKLWPIRTVIETQCKPGFYFQVSKTHQKKGFDEHRCTGGEASGWLDLNKDPDEKGYAWPAYCRGYCDPFDPASLSSGVEIVQDPTSQPNPIYNNDKRVLPVGTQYILKCKDGFKPKNPRYKDGKQQLSCDGNWRDTITGKQPADLLQCTADGCPLISNTNLPDNTVKEEGSGCVGDVKLDGCRVTIKCAKTDGTGGSAGFYMPNKPTGYQLNCNKGSWYDENNALVQTNAQGKFPGTCEKGCVGLSQTEHIYSSIVNGPTNPGNRNDEVTIYPIGTQITTTCSDGYVRPILGVQVDVVFNCESRGWKATIDALGQAVYLGSCVPACAIPAIDLSIKQNVIGQTSSKKGTQWVQQFGSITVTCNTDYAPVGNQPSPQNLVCDGGSAGWRDPVTNRTNVPILQCIAEGAPGCTEVPVGSGVNVTYSGNCTKADGLLPKGCVIGIKCRDGYYPDGSFTVSETGWQNLSCKAGKDGYSDVITGQNNVTMLRCIQACVYPDSYVTARYVTRADPSLVFSVPYAGKQYLKPGGTVVTTCKPLSAGYYWWDEADKNRVEMDHLSDFAYTCLGGSSQYRKEFGGRTGALPGDMCSGTCLAQRSSDTTDVRNLYRDGTAEFTTSGVRYVAAVEYRVTCRPGYEYPKGTLEAARGYQRLLCVGGADSYQDMDTLVTHAQITQCTKAPEPRCPQIDTVTQKVAWAPLSGDCVAQSGTIPVGCSITVTCQAGYFPIQGYTGVSATSTFTCKKLTNNTAIWVELTTDAPVPPLTCQLGCAVLSLNGSAQIIQDSPTIESGGVRYYQFNSLVTVSCAPGYVAEGAYFPQTLNLQFKCVGSYVVLPWQNVEMGGYEKGPFMACVKYCPKLDFELLGGVSIDAWRAPREKILNGQPIVLAGGSYELICRNGYTYRPPRINNTQFIICDANGQYVEFNNGGPNITNPTIQVCSRETGEGCAAPPVSSNAKISQQSNCALVNGRYPKGCAVTMECNENYGPIEAKFNISGKQQLICKDGYDWYDSQGNKVTQSMTCTSACKVESSTYSTIKNTTSITIIMGGVTFIPAGGQLVIECVGDGVIWKSDSSLSNKQHVYTCNGGTSNQWQESSSGSSATIPGDGCINTCPPLNYSPSASVKDDQPTFYEHDGKKLVADQAMYLFTCHPGYQRPDGTTSEEKAKCNGATRSYVVPATGAPFTGSSQCVPIATGCVDLPYNSTIIEYMFFTTCQRMQGAYLPDTCEVGFRCLPGYKPDVSTYNTANGYRNLTCVHRQGAYEWQDSSTKVKVTGTPLNCIPGCNNGTNNSKPPYELKGYTEYWPHTEYTKDPNGVYIPPSKSYAATCFVAGQYNGSAFKTTYYSCPVSPDYYNSYCEGACRELQQPYPTGVAPKGAQGLHLLGLDYIFAETYYDFFCKDGYGYKEEPYKSTGYQRIACNQDSTYTDRTANKVNSTYIAPCVLKQGCTELTKLPLVKGPSEGSSCAKPTATSYKESCMLTYVCETNSYPKDVGYLYMGNQQMTCTKGTVAWTVTNGLYAGRTATQTLECQQGCAQTNITTVSSILTSINIFVTKTNYPVKNNVPNAETLTCVSTQSRTNIQTLLRNMTRTSLQYFCSSSKTSDNQLKIDDKELCPNTCPALAITQTNGLNVTSPAIYNPYGAGDIIKAQTGYTFSCNPGYDMVYPTGTSGTVSYICQPDGTIRYNSQQFNPGNPPQCQQKPQCTKPQTNPNVLIDYDQSSCGQMTDTTANSGCTLAAKCQNGTYPSSEDQLSQSTFNYQCLTRGNQPLDWRNAANPSETYNLTCQVGCKPPSTNSSTYLEVKLIDPTGQSQVVRCGSLATVPEGTKQYYCPPKGISPDANYQCMGICLLPAIPQGITAVYTSPETWFVTSFKNATSSYNWTPASTPLFLNSLTSFTCPAGRQFTGLDTNVRRLKCVISHDEAGNPVTVSQDDAGNPVTSVGTCS